MVSRQRPETTVPTSAPRPGRRPGPARRAAVGLLSLLALALVIPLLGVDGCEPTDDDGDGYTTPIDCDDANPNVHPGAPETCNGADDDCDGTNDDGFQTTWYADQDGDGYGDDSRMTTACTQPAGYVSNPMDCDDRDATAYPGATEVCDDRDNDCDSFADNSLLTWYIDADGDGWGDSSVNVVEFVCDQPDGYVSLPGDCDDSDRNVHPGAADPPGDGVDQDCDGQS